MTNSEHGLRHKMHTGISEYFYKEHKLNDGVSIMYRLKGHDRDNLREHGFAGLVYSLADAKRIVSNLNKALSWMVTAEATLIGSRKYYTYKNPDKGGVNVEANESAS